MPINNHSGSLGVGHYTACVKQLGTEQWLVCNDSSVRPVDQSLSWTDAQFVVYCGRD